MQAVHKRADGTERHRKKLEKSSKNPLTNASDCDIIYRLPTSGRAEPKGTAKKLKKSLKNLLTNGSECDIINKLLTSSERITKKESSLKIEQQSCVQA